MTAKGVRAGKGFVEIFADDSPFIAGMKGLGKKAKRAGVGAIKLGTGLAAIGAGGISWPLKLAADMEKTETAFTTMLKSASAAKTLLGEIQSFAASTPFQFDELSDAGKKLLAFGTDAKSVVPELRRIGDIAAAINVPIGELSEIYGKARVQGRLFAEDINQLTGRGIPIIQELAKQFGVTDQEVRQLVKDGKVGFKNLEQAFRDLTSGQGKFAGGMEKQSKTLSGLWSTLKDNIALAVRPLGQALLPVMKQITTRVITIVQAVAKWAQANPSIVAGIGKILLGVTLLGGALIGVGTVLVGLVSVFSAIGTVGAAIFSPAGLIVAGVAALGIGAAALLHRFGALMPVLQNVGRAFMRVFGTLKQTFGGIMAAFQSGRMVLAARIAFSGVKLAALEGIQEIAKGMDFLVEHAGLINLAIKKIFIESFMKLAAAIPRLIAASFKGVGAVAGVVGDVLGGGGEGQGFNLAGRLDPAIQAERQRFRGLNQAARRPARNMPRGINRVPSGPAGGTSGVLNQQLAVLRDIRQQGGFQ